MILIVGTFVTCVSILSLLYQIYMIELNKAEILSLYALLQMAEIAKVYHECCSYMEILDEGSLVKAINSTKHQDEGGENQDFLEIEDADSQSNVFGSQKRAGLRASQLSEDEKEAEFQTKYAERKRRRGRRAGIKRSAHNFAGQDVYT